MTVKLPQLVWNSSVHFFLASSGCFGFLAPPSGLGAGAFAICWQPFAAAAGAGAAALVEVDGAPPPLGMSAVFVPLEPQAASDKAARTGRAGASRRFIGGGG